MLCQHTEITCFCSVLSPWNTKMPLCDQFLFTSLPILCLISHKRSTQSYESVQQQGWKQSSCLRGCIQCSCKSNAGKHYTDCFKGILGNAEKESSLELLNFPSLVSYILAQLIHGLNPADEYCPKTLNLSGMPKFTVYVKYLGQFQLCIHII